MNGRYMRGTVYDYTFEEPAAFAWECGARGLFDLPPRQSAQDKSLDHRPKASNFSRATRWPLDVSTISTSSDVPVRKRRIRRSSLAPIDTSVAPRGGTKASIAAVACL